MSLEDGAIALALQDHAVFAYAVGVQFDVYASEEARPASRLSVKG